MLAVGPDFFTTMKIPLTLGRVLRPEDMSGKPSVAIVNKAFVRRFIGGKNPIGLHFGGGDAKDQQWAIVGVVSDTKYQNLRSTEAPTAFIPLAEGGTTFALRTAITPAGMMPTVRSIVNETDSNLPVIRMRTQSEAIDQLLFNERLIARLFGLFGSLGLVLACIGLYGLLSYEVAQRTREIGIRTALGAQRRDVWLLVLRQGLMLVFCGAAAGIAVAIGVTRLLDSLLYGVHSTDAITLTAVAGLLVIVGIAACLLPAQRAVSVDPMQALRTE
jgi:predicted permease